MFDWNLNNCWSCWTCEGEKHSSFVGASRTRCFVFFFAEFPRERTQIYLAIQYLYFLLRTENIRPPKSLLSRGEQNPLISTALTSANQHSNTASQARRQFVVSLSQKVTNNSRGIQQSSTTILSPQREAVALNLQRLSRIFLFAPSTAFSKPSVHPERSRDSGFDVAGNFWGDYFLYLYCYDEGWFYLYILLLSLIKMWGCLFLPMRHGRENCLRNHSIQRVYSWRSQNCSVGLMFKL